MPAEIYFRNGGHVTVAPSLDALMEAVHGASGRPVMVPAYAGGRLVVNWDNVLYAEDRLDLGDPHSSP